MAKGQGRSSGQGVKLLYIRDYLYTHATKEHPKNAKDISKYLASMGVSASVKTIYNDILRLQIDFGVPIEYNPSKWGYYITQPQFEPYELRLLVDCVQSAKFLTENVKTSSHFLHCRFWMLKDVRRCSVMLPVVSSALIGSYFPAVRGDQSYWQCPHRRYYNNASSFSAWSAPAVFEA